ncbi:MAG: hypothetical protein Q9160_009125 [Pyrenula sp. 1 TL-2023]
MLDLKRNALLLGTATSFCIATPVDGPIELRVKPIQYCEIGDSYASGVAWVGAFNQDNAYDGNKDGCLRINHASAAQLANDKSWYEKGYPPKLNFKACSGAQLVDMKPQMDSCVDGSNDIRNVRFTVMTSGGNNAKFFDIAERCVYQRYKDHDYGPDFKDDQDLNRCKGDCCKAIKASQDYIQASTWSPGGLQFDLWRTIRDIVDSSAAHKDPNHKLYVTGYAQFWSNDKGTDWCNRESFGADPTGHQPTLSSELRSKMNSLVQLINSKYVSVITLFEKKQVGFIDIDPRFEKHRFCEPGSGHREQYYSDDTWFWNLSFPVLTESEPPEDPILREIVGGNFDRDIGPNSKTGNIGKGYQMRPFHPKDPGHTRIKEAVIQALKNDKVEGVKP